MKNKQFETFLNEYFQDDVGSIMASKILKKIDRSLHENIPLLELHANMHNVYLDLETEQVKITGLLVSDPEVVILLEEYKSRLQKLTLKRCLK